jgi:WD40 repeat protein/serine/threonine protein kinase
MTADPSAALLEERLQDLFLRWMQAEDEGRATDCRQLLAENPDLAPYLREFFPPDDPLRDLVPPRAVLRPGSAFGDYDRIELIGRGGMGEVYRAHQKSLDRTVALKMIRDAGTADLASVELFREEARHVAALRSAHIVTIYEVGEWQGRPYFSMELIEGGSLAHHLERFRRDPRASARLLATVARAVQHAHERGILHRDLKPANILLAHPEGSGQAVAPAGLPSTVSAAPGAVAKETPRGEAEALHRGPGGDIPLTALTPYVSDFGLARKLDPEGTLGLGGGVAGTPPYMAPEQARGEPVLTTAVDVYGLGAILHTLLTGRPPFVGANRAEVLALVKEKPPEPPWQHNPRADRDLSRICLKCLEKDPARRYPTALDLALDLERWLAGRETTVRRFGPAERVVKWARRRPAVAALLLLCLGAMTAGAHGWVRAWQHNNERIRTQERQLYVSGIQKAAGHVAAKQYDKAEAELDDCPPHLRDWEWYYLSRQTRRERTVLRGHSGRVVAVAYSPDGRQLLSGDDDGLVLLWDLKGAKHAVVGMQPGGVTSAAFGGGGAWFVTAGESQSVRVWDAATRAVLHTLPSPGQLAAASRDAGLVAVAHRKDGIRVWELDRQGLRPGRRLPAPSGTLNHLALSPDGRYLALAGLDYLLEIHDLRSENARPLMRRLPRTPRDQRADLYTVAFSRDSKYLAVGTTPLTVLKLPGCEEEQRYFAEGNLRSGVIAFGHGDRLLAATHRYLFRVWDRETGSVVLAPRDGRNFDLAVDFSPDGRQLALARKTEVVLQSLAPAAGGSREIRLPDRPRAWALAFSPDGKTLAVRGGDRQVFVLDTDTDEVTNTLRAEDRIDDWADLVFSPSGQLLSGCEGSRLAVWDVKPGAAPRKLPPIPAQNVLSLAVSPDGAKVATSEKGGRILLWDVLTGVQERFFDGATGDVQALAFRPPQKGRPWDELAAADQNGHVHLWDLRTGQGKQLPGPHRGSAVGLAFSPDGTRLASAGADFTVKVWDLRAGAEALSILHSAPLHGLAFSPDGWRLAACGQDNRIILWDAANGAELLSLTGHTGPVTHLAFSPSGLLASCSHDGTVRIWDGRPESRPESAAREGD